MRIFLFIVSVLLISTQACQFNSAEELFPPPSGNCDTADAKYSKSISRILNTNCSVPACHDGAGAPGDFRNYNGTKNYLDIGRQRFLNAINHIGPSPMPKNGAKLSDCDLLQLTTWINNGYRNN